MWILPARPTAMSRAACAETTSVRSLVARITPLAQRIVSRRRAAMAPVKPAKIQTIAPKIAVDSAATASAWATFAPKRTPNRRAFVRQIAQRRAAMAAVTWAKMRRIVRRTAAQQVPVATRFVTRMRISHPAPWTAVFVAMASAPRGLAKRSQVARPTARRPALPTVIAMTTTRARSTPVAAAAHASTRAHATITTCVPTTSVCWASARFSALLQPARTTSLARLTCATRRQAASTLATT